MFGSQISIIIPAYNEQEGIGKVLQQLAESAELEGAEIIVIDDASTDQTSLIVSQFINVRLIKNRVNLGYGSSLIIGVKASTRDYVFWFDGDGQHRVEDLVKIAQVLIIDDLDYCIGTRGKDSYEVYNRRLGKWILKTGVEFTAGQKVTDFNSGLRGFRRSVIKKYLHLLPQRFGASTVTTLIMLQRGYLGEEVPIVVLKRVGKSTVNQIKDGVQSLFLILRILLLFAPLRFFGTMGSLLIVLGFTYGFYEALTNKLGFPVLAMLVIFLGVESLLLGLISDQISRLRIELLEKD
jgi:glycosyltransferase involved in cell wall biosynthesis